MKLDQDALFRAELYTEQLNDMYATVRIFIDKNPNNFMKNELAEACTSISAAHKLSRYYCDAEHFDQWDRILEHSRSLLIKAGAKNV